MDDLKDRAKAAEDRKEKPGYDGHHFRRARRQTGRRALRSYFGRRPSEKSFGSERLAPAGRPGSRGAAPLLPDAASGPIVIAQSRCLRISVEAHRVRRRRHARRQPGSDCRSARRDLPGARPRAAEPRALALDRRAVAPPGVPRARSRRPGREPCRGLQDRLPAPARRPGLSRAAVQGAAELSPSSRRGTTSSSASRPGNPGAGSRISSTAMAGPGSSRRSRPPTIIRRSRIRRCSKGARRDRRGTARQRHGRDSTFDMAMARDAGIGAIGVSWGYHRPRPCAKAGAEAIVHSYAELPRHLEETLLAPSLV